MKQPTKRIRYGVQAMEAMKQEVVIRNKAIEQLEADNAVYLSEKNRLGETNAWLTEQNDALKKEVVAANKTCDGLIDKIAECAAKDKMLCETINDLRGKYQNSEERNKDLRNANSAYARAHDKAQAEQAQVALRLYIYKAIAIVAVVANLVLGAILVVG